MDSALLKDEKNKRKRRKLRKYTDQSKILVSNKPAGDLELMCKSKERGKKRQISEERNAAIFKKKKKPRNVSAFISGSEATTNCANSGDISNVHSEISSSSKKKHNLVSSKAESIMKKKNRARAHKKIKSDDDIISKNIERKIQHFNSDAPVKEVKNIKRKTLNEFKPMNNIKLKNKKRICDKKKFLSLQKNESESSNESDEDQEIRNELKGSSIYKNIQKLLKGNPSLLPTVDICEEELQEMTKSLSESEDESIECWDDASTDNSDEESERLSKDSPKSTSSEKAKLDSEKCLKKAQSDPWIDTNEEKPITTTSVCAFNRTVKNKLSHRDEKIISKKETPSLREKTLEKLQGAKFRYLNEKLYTESGTDSFNYFQNNTDEYMDYHKGYSLQVAKWPLNPVDKIISSLQKMKKNLIIADMGCGDAKIAQKLRNCSVHSFDLVALNDFVTPCNISKVPLSNESVDVVVFCLSLMGTNLKEYLQEAYRIAKLGGILKIAEVESRIPNLDKFIKSIETLGFSIVKKDVEHKLFVFLEFKKINKKKKKGVMMQDITLKPCLYKKR